jgi:hypothetical protein
MKAFETRSLIPQKGETLMKWFPTLALLTLVALIAVPGAMAQVVLKADIPFAFTVGDRPLPAGEYTISAPESGLIRVSNDQTHDTATVAISHGNHDASPNSKLQFNRYGDRYFLHRIFCPNATAMNVDIAVWSREKKARSLEAKLNHSEQILVAAR